MPEDKKIARMLIEEYISWHNYYLSFRQLKCGESHMTYPWPGIQLMMDLTDWSEILILSGDRKNGRLIKNLTDWLETLAAGRYNTC
jgi:hypothetical protein